MNDAYRHVKTEKIKAFHILETYTGLSPNAVMIHFVLASPTSSAVMDSWKFVIITDSASFVSCSVSMIMKFLSLKVFALDFVKLRDCVVDTDSLEIAPEAHENIEVGKDSHIASPFVS